MTVRKVAGTVKFPESATEKSSGLPFHLLFLLCVLLQHSPPVCRQASMVFPVPYDKKHGLVKVPEFKWHGSSHVPREQVSLSLFHNICHKERALISSAWVKHLVLTMQKDIILLGASLAGKEGSAQRGAPGQTTHCFYSTGSKFMYVTILMCITKFSSKMVYIPTSGTHEQPFLNQNNNSLVCSIMSKAFKCNI